MDKQHTEDTPYAAATGGREAVTLDNVTAQHKSILLLEAGIEGAEKQIEYLSQAIALMQAQIKQQRVYIKGYKSLLKQAKKDVQASCALQYDLASDLIVFNLIEKDDTPNQADQQHMVSMFAGE